MGIVLVGLYQMYIAGEYFFDIRFEQVSCRVSAKHVARLSGLSVDHTNILQVCLQFKTH